MPGWCPAPCFVADAVGLGDLIADHDVVVTGEGRFDWQSLHGKVVVRGRRRARSPHAVPTVVVAGEVLVGRRELSAAGITAAYAVGETPRAGGRRARRARADPRAPGSPAWREPGHVERNVGRAGVVPWTGTTSASGAVAEVDAHRTAVQRAPRRDHERDHRDADATETHGVLLTDFAASKVRSLLEQEGRDDLRLRVAVQPGGCSGLIYQLYFDERVLDGDVVKDYDGVEVVVDRMSVPYLDGATIDFADSIEKQGFTIDNPNAGSACACGGSFS